MTTPWRRAVCVCVQRYTTVDTDDWVALSPTQSRPTRTRSSSSKPQQAELVVKHREVEVNVHLQAGVGVSLVNRDNQEVIYATLHDIHLEYISTQNGVGFEMSVRNIQVGSAGGRA